MQTQTTAMMPTNGRGLARKALMAVGLTVAFLPVMALWALRPMVLIRFGAFRSDRIGHFAVNTELYLCQRDLGEHPKRTIDIFSHAPTVSNNQLKRMWDRNLNVWPLARILYRLLSRFPGSTKHIIRLPSDRDSQGLLAHTSTHLTFTSREERDARSGLAGMGIGEGAPFVCFMARNSSYLAEIYPDDSWLHHDYRDSSIETYLPAAEALTEMGYHTLRMGSSVMEDLECSNPMVIDYARKHRSELLDIYLAAKCDFFFCSDVGFVGVPAIFRTPIAWVNYVPVAATTVWNSDDLFIPKKLWLESEGRYLKFQEILESGAGEFFQSEQYRQAGISLVDNTAAEIADLVTEMEQRLKGAWISQDDDEQLQQAYWTIFKASMSKGGVLSRIGAKFLRENRDLLT
jgi:putative glycosyltransferase (TIGR04372 family)